MDAAPDLYVLVHPERYISNDWGVLGLRDNEDLECFFADHDDYEHEYGVAASAAARGAHQAVCILDPMDVESEAEAITDEEPSLEVLASHPGARVAEGVPAGLFRLCEADAFGIEAVVREKIGRFQAITGNGVVHVGGYARHDCVARAVKTLRELGWEASVHEPTTLPLALCE